jgi:hypothetical protein
MQAYLSARYEQVRSFSQTALKQPRLGHPQSRLAVSGEIFRTSAVSATLNPPVTQLYNPTFAAIELKQ